MRLLIVFSFIAVFRSYIVFAQPESSQTNSTDDVLNHAVYGYGAQLLNTRDAFRTSLTRATVPGGTVTLVGCQEEPPRTWNPQGEPLGQKS